ncbi:hypothetical protein ABPG75_011962 [Micractinium tetrahymenae]
MGNPKLNGDIKKRGLKNRMSIRDYLDAAEAAGKGVVVIVDSMHVYCAASSGYSQPGPAGKPLRSFRERKAAVQLDSLVCELRSHPAVLAVKVRRVQWAVGLQGKEMKAVQLALPSNVAVQVSDRHVFTALSVGTGFACGLDASRTAWCWGRADADVLGNSGIVQDTAAPVQVTGGHQFASIASAPDFTYALDTSSAAWCWGRGVEGQLGYGAYNNSGDPVQVVGGHQFAALYVSELHSCGLDGAGAAWCWASGGDRLRLSRDCLAECVALASSACRPVSMSRKFSPWCLRVELSLQL